MSELFQTEQYFRNRLHAVGRAHRFQATNLEAWRIWQQELRARIQELLGLRRLLPTPLNPRITETVQCDGYVRQRVEIDTEPGVVMPMYVLIPNHVYQDGNQGVGNTAPTVIAAHGHSGGGKLSIAGVIDRPEIAEAERKYNYAYGVAAVRHGYVVYCPDARGFGERRESLTGGPNSWLESSCRQLTHMGMPLGLTVAGMWTWDLMVLLDYIATRPETAGEKIGCIGLSGGGAQTLWLAALDERVACSVISGYLYGVEDALLYLAANCDCNYIPHMWESADMGDVAALIAPRPLLVEAARQDPLNGPRGIDNVIEQCEIIQRTYALLGEEDHFDTYFFDGGHIWNGATLLPWLDRWLRA